MSRRYDLLAVSGRISRAGYSWTVLVAAVVSCLASLAAYESWSAGLAVRLAANPLSIESEFDDLGAAVNRAAAAGLTERPPGTLCVFLLGSSTAAAAFASPQALSDALRQPGGPEVEVILLTHRGQRTLGRLRRPVWHR